MSDKRRTTAGSLLTLALLAALPATGCGKHETASDNQYREDVEAAMELATSDFEREVLSDFDITRSEYDEAVDRYVQCVNDRGIELSTIDQGGYYIYTHPDAGLGEAATNEVLDQCRIGTVDLVEGLYVSKVTNAEQGEA